MKGDNHGYCEKYIWRYLHRDALVIHRSEKDISKLRAKGGGEMIEFAWFIFGVFIGGIVATLTLCMFMVNKRGR